MLIGGKQALFSISKNGIITIDAGDCAIFTLSINAGDVLNPLCYQLEDGDKVCFSVMENGQPFQCGLIRKVFTKKDINEDWNVMIQFDTNDTQNVLPGRYNYQVKLLQIRQNKQYVYTITPMRKFIVC